MTYLVDGAGIELIAGFEGYVNGAYNDSDNPPNATCGYGHLIHTGPVTEQDKRDYDGRGRVFFLDLLHQDIQRVALAPMERYLHVPLNQNQINAVTSATFNCGPGFVEGTVGKLINARAWGPAASAFMLWAHPAVLAGRRGTEARLFRTPVSPPLPWLEPNERRWVLEYDRLHSHKQDPGRQRVLRAVMTAQRKLIWHAAQGPGGWGIRNRRQRYHTLLVRTG